MLESKEEVLSEWWAAYLTLLLRSREPIHTQAFPSPASQFQPRLGQMVGAGKCSRATRWSILRGLLFPFCLGAMWWPWVSDDKTQQACPCPSLPCGLHPMTPLPLALAPSPSTVVWLNPGEGQELRGGGMKNWWLSSVCRNGR